MAEEASGITIPPAFRVDTRQYTLSCKGRLVDLPRIPMDILLLLLRRPGELVTRAEIAEAIWPGSSPDEVTYRINTAITRIRRALDDDPAAPRYLDTVIGRGYRFIAPVESETPEAPSQPSLSERDPASASGTGPELSADPGLPCGHSSIASQLGPYPPSNALPGARRTWAWIWWTAASLVATVVLALSVYFLRSSHHEAALALPAPVRLTGNNSDNPVGTAALSPDGQRLVFTDRDGVLIQGRHDLTPTPLTVPPLTKIDRLSWFPDGKRIAVSGLAAGTNDPQLWATAVAGAAPPSLVREGARSGVVASVTGQIAFLNSDATEIWRQDGSAAPRLLRTATPGSTFSDLTWFRDGSVLFANEIRGAGPQSAMSNPDVAVSPARSTLLAIKADGGSVLASQNGVRLLEGCSFPDGHVALQGMDEQHRPVELSETVHAQAHELTFAPPVQTQFPGGHLRSCSVASATGDVAALAQTGKPVIYVGELSANGRALLQVHAITSAEHESYPHAWTPDSQSVLFEQVSHDVWYLLRQSLDRHDPQPLLAPQLAGVMPRYSPDSRWILFYRKDEANGRTQLFHMLAHGQDGPPAQLAVPSGEVRCPREGTTCVLRVLDTIAHKVILYALDPANGSTRVHRVLAWDEAAGVDWDVSPDGKSVVVCGPTNSKGVLNVFTLLGQDKRSLFFPVDGGALRAVNWAASGNGWFGVTYTETGSNLYFLDPRGKATLLRSPTTTTWGVPSPNGRVLAFIDRDQDKNVWVIPHDEHGQMSAIFR